jgi:hypothetical protein
MKGVYHFFVVVLISLMVFPGTNSAQVREGFYKHCFGLYFYYSALNNTSRGYENTFLNEKSDILIKYPSKYSLISVNLHIDHATENLWGLHASFKSNFFGDCWYLFFPSAEAGEAGEITMQDKMSMNYFSSVLQWNHGVNFLVTEKLRVAAGGSFSVYAIDTYNQDGSQYLKNGGHFMIGPYINGDVVLAPWLLFRVELTSNFTFYQRGNAADEEIIDKIKNPYIINVFPYFMTKFGLMLGAEFTFVNRMIDTNYSNPLNPDIFTGYQFHATRTDLKLGFLF